MVVNRKSYDKIKSIYVLHTYIRRHSISQQQQKRDNTKLLCCAYWCQHLYNNFMSDARSIVEFLGARCASRVNCKNHDSTFGP